jgi:hypothetical protein
MAETNVGLVLNFDLLKTNLNAAYEKNGEKYKILLLPSDITEESSGVSLGEMVESINTLFGKEIVEKKAITDSMESVNTSKDESKKFKWEKITFHLKAAYFYKDSEKDVSDYAFAIKVDLADAVPDLGFIKVNTIGLAVWNTQRTAILSRMNMGSIDDLLKAIEAPK